MNKVGDLIVTRFSEVEETPKPYKESSHLKAHKYPAGTGFIIRNYLKLIKQYPELSFIVHLITLSEVE